VGKGLGRYWANQSMSGRPEDHTGDYRLIAASAQSPTHVAITAGRHVLSGGDLLRFSQRLTQTPSAPVALSLGLRTDRATQLRVEVCARQLIYAADCVLGVTDVAPTQGKVVPLTLALKGTLPMGGHSIGSLPTVFSVMLGTQGARAELYDMRLVDQAGRNYLHNGDFSSGLAHWFFTSDRYHLPWHAKNLFVHLVFEQGLLGLLSFALLTGITLWRLSLGAARRHPLAPWLAAALVSLLLVGLVDSVLDMPRVSFVLALMLLIGLTMPGSAARRHDPGFRPRAGLKMKG
jgi:hypothetical protein